MILDYVAPASLEEACALGSEPGAVFMAGGTDVIASQADGRRRVERVISLRGVPELRERRWESETSDHGEAAGPTLVGQDGSWGEVLYLGAGITHDQVANDPELRRVFPALSEACGAVGAWPTRVAGTLGGNVCTAAPSADSAGPLLVYRAQVVLVRGTSRRTLPLGDFYVDAGRTVLQPGELLLAFRLPHPGPHGAAFFKLGRRQAMEIALASATAVVRLDGDGACQDVRLALGTAAPTPLLVEGVAEAVRGRAVDDGLLTELVDLAVGQCRPRSSSFRCDPGYRRRLVGVVARRALAEAWKRATDKVVEA